MNSKGEYALVGPYKDASSGLMIATMSKTLSAPGTDSKTYLLLYLDF